MIDIDSVINNILRDETSEFIFLSRKERKGIIELFLGEYVLFNKIKDVEKYYSSKDTDFFIIPPYRILINIGLPAIDDGKPIITFWIRERFNINYNELIDLIPKDNETILSEEFKYVENEKEYANTVEKIIKDEIGQGEGANFVIKRSLVSKFEKVDNKVLLQVFINLLEQEKDAYWTFLVRSDIINFIGASPEMHIKVENNNLSMMPISGTFKTSIENEEKEDIIKFLRDGKEQYELFMVVDEELKMISSLCDSKINVEGPFLIRMSDLIHTGYYINGNSSKSVFSILEGTMFAPTVVGSPLENAMKVITKYEKTGRSYYSSLIAYISKDKGNSNIDSCILIRTSEIEKDGSILISLGATITRESNPIRESKETETKAVRLTKAFYSTEKINDLYSILKERNSCISPFWIKGKANKSKNIKTNICKNKKVLIIDNEDKFTQMLKYILTKIGFDITIVSYLEKINFEKFNLFILGPGPGDPRDLSDNKVKSNLDILKTLLKENKKFLGICFGHQIICNYLGFQLKKIKPITQGIQKKISLFEKEEEVGFYNTFVAVYNDKYNDLEVAMDYVTKEIYALRSKNFTTMQFHPESILTKKGDLLLHDITKRLLSHDN